MEKCDTQNGLFAEDVVVSGISGRFPNSDNVEELAHNLYNKIDMIDDLETRWPHFHPDVPPRTGKIRNLEKFDASFFSIHHRLANNTDPQARMLLEHSYEAILDAGISPQSLIGSRTGVFIGCSSSDSKDLFVFKVPTRDGHAVSGNANFYLANRISFALGLCGPSFVVDTACSSSGYALDLAYKYIQDGTCDAALVGGAQLVLNSVSTAEFKRLRVLALDGISRPFDKEASGFVRGESISVVFLQKQKDSKRIYANLLHVRSNNDGFKQEGSSFPSRVKQEELYNQCLETTGLKPNQIGYIELHATGTFFGDAEEVAGVDAAYGQNRSTPLAIGSVKSNLGHTESASAIASIAKLILTLEKQEIPPNINLKELRDDIPGFTEGRLRVVQEVEPLVSPFVSLNSFGLGGANVHAIFKGNEKTKIDCGVPKDHLYRLVFWSGRTEAAIESIFDEILKKPLDAEYVALLHNSQLKTTPSNTYRGFGLFLHDEPSQKAICIQRNIKNFNSVKKPVVWVYSGIGSQWLEMGKGLMSLPVFANSIEFCHKVLTAKGINLKEIISSSDETTFENVLHSYVGIIAIEIALTDVLKSMSLEPDYIIGHSVGEIACAYCDGCFTAEEAILVAYARGLSNNETKTILGGMAAVGKNHKELADILPKDLDIACHNAPDSTTISGPAESVTSFVAQLNAENVFAKEISCSGVPLHSRYIKEMGKSLSKLLEQIITKPKTRSTKWLSSTFAADDSNEDLLQSSAAYHTKNLLSPVLFQEAVEQLPDCITIEVAPHGLLKPILKRSLKDGTHFSLAQRDIKNGTEHLMSTLGEIFQNGIDMDIANLYPAIEFPVSRGTAMISPRIKWDHGLDLFVPSFVASDWFDKRNFLINISDKEFEFIQGHVIDGKILFPGMGLISLVWEAFALVNSTVTHKMAVIFEDVKFMRATSMNKNQDVILTVSILKGSGIFEITEGRSVVAQGRVRQYESDIMTDIQAPVNDESFKLLEEDFYKEMRLRGYHHKNLFRAVTESRDDGLEGQIKWNNNWTSFIDCLLQFQILTQDTRMLVLPTKFRSLIINPFVHEKILKESTNETIKSVTCPFQKIIRAGGVEIHEFEGTAVNRRRPIDPVLEVYKFIPHHGTSMTKLDVAKFSVQLLLENTQTARVISVEIDANDGKEPLSEFVFKSVSDMPMVTTDINYLTSSKDADLGNVVVSQKDLPEFSNANFIIRSCCLNDTDFLVEAKRSIHPTGFIISREKKDTKVPVEAPEGLQIIASILLEDELVLLLQFVEPFVTPGQLIKVTTNTAEWLEELKQAVTTESTLIYSQNEETSGILGLYNCIKRELSAATKLTCVFIDDGTAPPFDVNLPFYSLQLQQGLAMNVFKDGQWGTYRHLKLVEDKSVKSRKDHYYVDCLVKGDMSTLNWCQGKLSEKAISDPNCVRIKYSALNFRDVMQTSGKLQFTHYNRLEQQLLLGHEFSGIQNGKRVMGLGVSGAFSNFYNEAGCLLWEVPDDWSLEAAATTPVCYITVLIAFFDIVHIKEGESVLIHAGSGGVGLAALYIAFHYGLEVFTTVGTQEKKDFLLKEFPKLKAENIGNSRDTSFERLVCVQTKGKGVNYVLNSLSEDKLRASLRCLAEGGTFLEIGKIDIMMKTKIDLGFLAKKIQIRTIFLETGGAKQLSDQLFREHLKAGIMKPLNTTVFDASEVQAAFRYLASGKHIGKVLIKVWDDENEELTLPIAVKRQVFCDKSKSFIVVGGLGGFGLELADWLVLRGCKHLVMSSSRGITNGYQANRIKLWRSYGVNVCVSTLNVTTEEGCTELLQEAIDFGPVGGIFNLAVALRDGMFENQTVEMFAESFAPKAVATRYLDEISRRLCPQLEHFVIFSSVSCGRGNPGQSNYGMANSIMERIIERRHAQNLPAKAIQWGAVGEVGLLADLQEKKSDMQISGTLPQKISSCIEVLDNLMTSNEALVGSMVVAEKHTFEFRKDNVIDSLFNILGIRDKKSISMDSPLSKLGLDSLMAVEITQLLEREFNLFLTMKELQTMTLYDLEQRTKGKMTSKDQTGKHSVGLEILLTNVVNERKNEGRIVCLKSGSADASNKILIIPGIEGTSGEAWEKLAETFRYDTYALQTSLFDSAETLQELHDAVIADVLELYADNDCFFLVAHSFGSLLTLELAKTLELGGRIGNVVMIDGSPLFFKRLTESLGLVNAPDEAIHNEILKNLIRIDFPSNYEAVMKRTLSGRNWSEKLENFLQLNAKESLNRKHSMSSIVGVFNRIKMSRVSNEASFPFLNATKIALVVPSEKLVNDIPENYDLNRYSSQNVECFTVNGNHTSIFKSSELSNFINSFN